MIEVRNLKKCFEGAPALEQVNLTVEPGRIMGVVGSNGAGKSTLLRVLSGIYKADGGEFVNHRQPLMQKK